MHKLESVKISELIGLVYGAFTSTFTNYKEEILSIIEL
jgi:hypothetical protein